MTTALQVASIIQDAAHLPAYDSMKLQKLVYYAQAWHLAWTGRPMFAEEFEAWQNGPVSRDVYREHKYNELPRVGVDDLDDDVRDTIAAVIEFYGSKDYGELIDLTHRDAPWLEARGNLPPNVPSRRIVKQSTMLDFYTHEALLNEDAPRRKARVKAAPQDVVSGVGARVIDRWRAGLDLLATK
jgi:uncharacterized phage-associated protein